MSIKQTDMARNVITTNCIQQSLQAQKQTKIQIKRKAIANKTVIELST
jgi:hypothetical protein